MTRNDKPLTPDELDLLVSEAMRITQSRADLLRRNDVLLIQLMKCQSERIKLLKWVKRKVKVPA